MPKVFIDPQFGGEDKGDGGIRRVVEAQRAHLPRLGWEVVNELGSADVIATHAINPLKNLTPKHVVVNHNHGLYWTEYEWDRWSRQANAEVIEAIDRADAVTGPSEWVSQIIRRAWLKKCYTLYHGVDLEDWPMPTTNEVDKYVLWNKTRPDAVCDPRPLDALAALLPNQQFVTTIGTARDNVIVTGKVPYEQAKQYVHSAGVYLATTRETFGIGTIEAMASGVPVLGWNWGGQAEFVEHGVTGWLCRPGDVEGLAEGLEYCLANRPRLSKAARDCVAGKFTWRVAIERYAALYAQLLDESSGRQSHGGSRPRATVIITCYKLERYLEAAIRSALTSIPDVEVLVVDDCSPGDGTGRSATQIVESFTDIGGNRVRYLRPDKNLYLAGALNFAVEQANSGIIIPLDADNELRGGADELVKRLESDRDVDIAYGAVEFVEVGADGAETGRRSVSKWPWQFIYSEQMIGHNQIPSTSAYRKSVWSRIGGYRTRCRTAEDADFWCRATSFGGRARRVTDATTFIYRDRQDSMSHVEKAWDWSSWYSWGKRTELTPMGAQLTREDRALKLAIPTNEPTLISVVMPVGPGHGKFIYDAVDSLLSQSFNQWELIIVNDSGEKLPWVPPFAIELTVDRATKSEKGADSPAAARNLGLSAARGKTFLLLDADDYLQPNALEVMWKSYDGKNIVYGDFFKQPGGDLDVLPELNYGFVPGSTPDSRRGNVLSNMPIPITFLAPTRVLKWFGGDVAFDENMEAWEDWDFLLQLCNAGLCGLRVSAGLFNYRVTSGQRRDALYLRREELRQEMLAKWGEYIDGSKELMACGACGGRPAVRTSPEISGPMAAQLAAATTVADHVVIEYIATEGGAQTFTGAKTGRQYRFSPRPADRVRYVAKEDAARLLQFDKMFKLYDGQLTADGAPLLVPAG